MSCDIPCYVALRHGAKVGLRCVIEVFPDHTHLLFGSGILQQIIAIVAVNVVIYLFT